MLLRAVVLLSVLNAIAGFMTPVSRAEGLQMLFNFGKKPAPAPPASSKSPVKPAATPAKTVSKVVASPVKAVATPAKTAATSKFIAPVKSVKATPAPVKSSVKTVAKPEVRSDNNNDFLGLVGSDVEAPNFDPFQLSAGRSEETINWYRAAELKHGRIAMLAALGLSVQPAFHLPDQVFDSTLGYGVVTKLYSERPEAIWQILLALAAVETFSLFKNGQGVAGDLGFDPLKLREKLYSNPEQFSKVQLQELKHGRLAMWGSSALLLQEYVTGYGPYEQLLPH